MSKYIFLFFLIVLLKCVISIEANTRLVRIINHEIPRNYNIKNEKDDVVCLSAGAKAKNRPTIETCGHYFTGLYELWEVPAEGKSGVIRMHNPQRSIYEDNVCIHIKNPINGTLIMGECNNENSEWIIKNNTIRLKKDEKYCIGRYYNENYNKTKINLNRCVEKNADNVEWKYQQWIASEESVYRCGYGYGICPDGLCCSKYGYCNNKESHCKIENGCQPRYGKCGYEKSECGIKNGRCSEHECCSKFGHCGVSDDYCEISKCNKYFGSCNYQ